MNNYEYIVASLPVINSDARGDIDYEGIISDIRSQLSRKDAALLDVLLSGFVSDNLNADFYIKAAASPNRFISGYFAFDMNVRNTRVEFLNKALSRPEGMDMLILSEDQESEFEEKEKVEAVLALEDILERERGLDNLMWEKIDELVRLDVFTIEAILAFVAKLQIIVRWLKLDPQTGRALFKQLVDEIRNNKKSIE